MIGSSHEKKDIVWANKDIRFFYTALDVIQMGDLARSLIWQTNFKPVGNKEKKDNILASNEGIYTIFFSKSSAQFKEDSETLFAVLEQWESACIFNKGCF